MALETDDAIVLKLHDFSETSQVAWVFTRRGGLVRVLAKGVRKNTRQRFAPGLDLLELGRCAFVRPRGDAALGTLTEWLQEDGFAGLRGGLLSLFGGIYAAEATTALTQDHDPHPELFDALRALLQGLSGGAEAAQAAAHLVRFQARLLTCAGFAPVLRQCVACGRPRTRTMRARFSSAAGGLLCPECQAGHREHIAICPAIVAGATARERPTEWFGLLDYHISHVAGRPLRSVPRLAAVLPRA